MISPKTQKKLPAILLIDDDAISREVMQLTLEMAGMAVDTAEDGAVALSWLGSGVAHPDVILMDTQMPGLSGLELVAALRKATKARIVAVSGSEVSGEIRGATDGFLLKPVEPESLFELLELKAKTAEKKAAKRTPRGKAGQDNSGNPVDAVVLGKFKAMMPETAVLEIYTATAADLEKRIPTLAAAIDARNGEEVHRIAHAIKGGCAMVGLTGAAAAASRIETGNLPESWAKELLQLNAAFSSLQGILRDRLL
jgi:CheY-like chemotaxis protein/HPt (histidine-containing phosphotransfer) domain-containing protein